MKLNQNFSVVNFAQQEIPVITEDTKTRYQWVPVGVIGPDDFFQNVTDAYRSHPGLAQRRRRAGRHVYRRYCRPYLW